MSPVAIILGTAQDAGIPHIACACRTCRRAWADPTLRRLPSSVAVTGADGRWVLLDASPALTEQLALLRRAIPHLAPWPSAIFLTHLHMGHYPGLLYLGQEAAAAPGLPVYGSAQVVGILQNNRPWSDLAAGGYVRFRAIAPGEPLSLAGLLLTGHLVPHRPDVSDMTAWRVAARGGRSLLYLPDVDYLDETILSLIAACDLALVDGSFYDDTELPGRDISRIPHPFLVESSRRLKPLLGTTQIIFTHFNHSNPVLLPNSPQAREMKARGFQLAREGMQISLSK
ncbi:MAG: MBL fold metallo-hydrolase [Anaerolineae bacterium]